LKIKDHIINVTEKAYSKMMKVMRIMGNKGIEYRIIQDITYAAGAWGDKMGKMERYKLLSERRKVGLRMIKGYRTLSGEAVRIIAGLIPLDLEVERKWVRKMVMDNGEVTWNEKNYKITGIKRNLEKGFLEEWQKRWESSGLGRRTAGWWPDVKGRMKAEWMQPNYYVTQILGGHRNFKEKLKGFGLVETDSIKKKGGRRTKRVCRSGQ
jgi:hypothetical protein